MGEEASLISDLNFTHLSEKLNKNRDDLKLSKVEDHLRPLIKPREPGRTKPQ